MSMDYTDKAQMRHRSLVSGASRRVNKIERSIVQARGALDRLKGTKREVDAADYLRGLEMALVDAERERDALRAANSDGWG